MRCRFNLARFCLIAKYLLIETPGVMILLLKLVHVANVELDLGNGHRAAEVVRVRAGTFQRPVQMDKRPVVNAQILQRQPKSSFERWFNHSTKEASTWHGLPARSKTRAHGTKPQERLFWPRGNLKSENNTTRAHRARGSCRFWRFCLASVLSCLAL